MSRMWSNAPSLDQYPHKPGHVFGSNPSREAAQRIKRHSDTLEEFVLSVLRVAGERGLTDFQIQDLAAKEGIVSLLRPRRAQLTARGEVKDSGMKREAPSGLLVTVWVLA